MWAAAAYCISGFKIDTARPRVLAENYGGIEGPRAPAPLLAPLMVVLAVAGLIMLFRRAAVLPAALVARNLTSVVLVFGFPALCLRYTYHACWLLTVPAALWVAGARPMPWFASHAAVTLCCVGIVASGLMLMRYKIVYRGTDPKVRYALSAAVRPLVCPSTPEDLNVRLTDVNPLVTKSCPPFW